MSPKLFFSAPCLTLATPTFQKLRELGDAFFGHQARPRKVSPNSPRHGPSLVKEGPELGSLRKGHGKKGHGHIKLDVNYYH